MKLTDLRAILAPKIYVQVREDVDTKKHTLGLIQPGDVVVVVEAEEKSDVLVVACTKLHNPDLRYIMYFDLETDLHEVFLPLKIKNSMFDAYLNAGSNLPYCAWLEQRFAEMKAPVASE